jgi:antitoxin component of MazEF toxin-antitoxin module
MAFIKKLVQHGNSSALIIEKPILEMLNITQETDLDIRTDGHSLIVTPIDPAVTNALASVNKKHSKTLKRLAK